MAIYNPTNYCPNNSPSNVHEPQQCGDPPSDIDLSLATKGDPGIEGQYWAMARYKICKHCSAFYCYEVEDSLT
jgi:hypothetical protein